MADPDTILALAEGTLPAPARVVTLDVACGDEELELPATELASAQQAGCRVTLLVRGLGTAAGGRPADERPSASHAKHSARAACAVDLLTERLATTAQRLVREGGNLSPEAVTLPAAMQRPEELALGAACQCASSPAVYLLLPAAALEAVQRGRALPMEDGVEADARAWWQGLLALTATASCVSLVPEAPGPGLSPLVPGRGWDGPSPALGELIPARPVRLRLDLDFGALLAASGGAPEELGRLAERIVLAADDALERVPGEAGPRRLALHLGGIARALIRGGRDPRKYATLTWLMARLAAFRAGARTASVQLARCRGSRGGLQPFPVPSTLEVAGAGVLDRAVLVHGARHSHLLCLSPWSLAPLDSGRDCLGLLPALACADSIAWRRPGHAMDPALYDEALRFAWAVATRS